MYKTVHNRHKCEAAISVRYMNDDKTFVARMLNYSDSGMYFESDSFFEEGTILYAQMTDGLVVHSDPEPDVKPHQVWLVEVKWCKEISKNGCCCYAIGVEYC